jgi:hypothetical protein
MSEPTPTTAATGATTAGATITGRRSALRRAPVLAVLAAALIVGGLVNSGAGKSARVAGAPPVQPVPVAAPADAISSSWFCAGATDSSNGPAPGEVVLANAASRPARGVVTLVPAGGAPVRVPVTIGADDTTTVPESVPGGASWVGAIVDIEAGAVAAEEEVFGSLGAASSPCATAGSSQWYFATGATLVNAGVVLSLLNPYPTDAIVDLSFTTNQGLEFPQDFQGLVVPADGLITVNLGAHLRRRSTIATTITASSGRFVAWKTDIVSTPTANEPLLGTAAANAPLADPASPYPGLTLALGAPGPATTWAWPQGDSGNGVVEQYVIYNPGTRTAQLQLSIDLDQGTAEPFELSVGPGQAVPVVSNQEVRIPPGVGHAALLQSLNGVPVVAERTMAAGSPSSWSGLGEMLGEQLPAAQWLLPDGGRADSDHEGWLYTYNPGHSTVQVTVYGLSGSGQVRLGRFAIPAGRRNGLNLNNLGKTFSSGLVVSASAPVFTELDYYGVNGTPGINLSSGVPLSS